MAVNEMRVFLMVAAMIGPSQATAAQRADTAEENYFAVMDRNGDGRITHREFQQHVQSQHPDLDRDQLEAFADDIMVIMDSDGDGEVTAVEYALAQHRRKGQCEDCE